MLTIALGVPGVGKSTVLKGLQEKVNFKFINYGDLMFDEAKKRKLVENRDQMRKLNKDVQVDLQMRAAKRIYEMARNESIIVDTHASIKTPYGYLPGLPEEIVKTLKPSHILLIECDAKSILSRRVKDTRTRDADALCEIEEHQEINRYYASVYSVLTNATLLIVNNEEDRLKQAVDKILPLLK